MLKKLIGMAPQEVKENVYKPSKLSLKLATSDQTNYSHTNYQNFPKDHDKRVLMICTEENELEMNNGKKFLTGNHPVETFVPVLHFIKAGFKVDVYTLNGKSAKIEMWAMPRKDDAVQGIYHQLEGQLAKPKNLNDFVKNEMATDDNYLGIFIPGGHGALLGLPESQAMNKLLHWAYEENRLILSLCHGPAALLAAGLDMKDENYLFKGFKIAAFPDGIDEKSPMIGYLPGQLKWKFGESLERLGVQIVNKKADDTCYKDRNLITGASPDAANAFGELSTKALMKKVKS